MKKPYSEPALDDLMHKVAIDVKARAEAAKDRLTNDPVERARVVELLKQHGFGLDENQELLPPGDLNR
jgi:hypothetical protein